MFFVPEKLKELADKAKNGVHAETTVRELLSWFGAHRRSWRNVLLIRDALENEGIYTFPDFEGEYIDNILIFKKIESPKPPQSDINKSEIPAEAEKQMADSLEFEESVTVTKQTNYQLIGPSHQISRLESANKIPVSVKPDDTVEKAVTIMLRYDYSQLPVMQNDRVVKGMISWRSLGSRLAIGKECNNVRDCFDKHQELTSTASLFEAVRIIADHDCVLVRTNDKKVCGIVTAYDISAQFQQLAEPFLLLGDIENHIRYQIRNFTEEELQTAKDPNDKEREIHNVSDLTFGEYIRLLENPDNWAKLKMRIDRTTFIAWLNKIRDIRNDVMHFDPDPIEPDDSKLLRDIAGLFNRSQELIS